ncbi:MAG: bacterial Ig-like domain-containing protein [Bacteroidaceae bacterium]|nr:bacterial Ig-like domain-containing protein [Bacteroidaceae bacterium]
MERFIYKLKLGFVALGLSLISATNTYAEKQGKIVFGTKNVQIDKTSVSANDNLKNTWKIETSGTTSFTQNPSYSQIGASKKPAKSVTFSTTIADAKKIKSVSAKLGGFNGTAGNVSISVTGKNVATGSLNATADVVVSSTSEADGNVIVIEITSIKKGVKAYEISYTYEEGTSDTPVKQFTGISVSGTPNEFWIGDSFNKNNMTVTAQYSDGTSENVTASAKFSEPDMKKAGKQDITVSYNGKTTTYSINVQTIENTKETAYTVDEAINIIKNGKGLSTMVYVKGTVSKVDKFDSSSKSITYWLDDNKFEIYKGVKANGQEFGSIDDIMVGADVIIYGTLTLYNKTVYEFNAKSQLVEYNDENVQIVVSEPVFSSQPIASKSYKLNEDASNIVVSVAGTPEPKLQWYKNTVNSNEGGTAISGATSNTYRPSTNLAGVTYYYCIATNSVGSVASSVSAIYVKSNATITLGTYQTKLLAGASDSYTFECDGDGSVNVRSKNEDVATVSTNGNVITVNALSEGTTTIIFNSVETDKYLSANKSYTLNVAPALVPASLDFSFKGGRVDIDKSKNMIQSGMGTDYSADPKLKFDDSNDYLLIAFADVADELSFQIKGNGFSKGTFDVLESADNKTFTSVKTYTSLGSTSNEKLTLAESSRFVKFVYTNKSKGNVGIGNISITKMEMPEEPSVSAEDGEKAGQAEKYVCNVKAGKFSTLCLPYGASVEGATLYTMDGKVVENGIVTALNFEVVEDNVAVPGVPYLFLATEDEQTFTKSASEAKDVTTSSNASGFTGTYSEYNLPVGSYFLYNDGTNQVFRKAGDSGDGSTYVKVQPFKCFITSMDEISESEPAANNSRNRISIGTFIDEATGIITLDTENVRSVNAKYVVNGRVVIVKDNVRYNANGQRLTDK